MKLISLAGSATPFVTGKWYYRKRPSRLHDYTRKDKSIYYPQVMQVHCDAAGNVRSVLSPSENGELRVLNRDIRKEYYIFYEEFTPVTTENLRFEVDNRYRIANRGAIDSLCNLDLGRYGHNTSLRRYLSHGSRRMRDRNVIYIHTATKDGCALKIMGSNESPRQAYFECLVPGWLLMFLEEVGDSRESIEKDPVETFVSQHENLEENTRRQINQGDFVDLPTPEGTLINDDDLALLQAVKFLIEQRDVNYGSRAGIRVSANGYTYEVDEPEELIKWANKRKEELTQYRHEVIEKIASLQSLTETLPK